MNDQEQASQLSALFDDALPADQSDLVVRRVLREPQLQETWGRYALIGAAMRGDPLSVPVTRRGDVASRVSAQLVAEPERPAAQVPPAVARGGERNLFARGAWSMAIAASVAAASLLVLRMQAPEGAAGAIQVAGASAAVSAPADETVLAARGGSQQTLMAASSPPPSYTTPVDNTPPGQQISAPLVNYVVAHSDVAASAVRLSPLSSVMNASYDLAQGTVEMSEAEIGAHR